jgi:hypothetical protein
MGEGQETSHAGAAGKHQSKPDRQRDQYEGLTAAWHAAWIGRQAPAPALPDHVGAFRHVACPNHNQLPGDRKHNWADK